MSSVKAAQYILVMALVSYALRALPLTLIRRQIRSRFVRSLLYYIPYATLAVMTAPAIFLLTSDPLAGGISLVMAGLTAWFTSSLPLCAAAASLSVFLVQVLHSLA